MYKNAKPPALGQISENLENLEITDTVKIGANPVLNWNDSYNNGLTLTEDTTIDFDKTPFTHIVVNSGVDLTFNIFEQGPVYVFIEVENGTQCTIIVLNTTQPFIQKSINSFNSNIYLLSFNIIPGTKLLIGNFVPDIGSLG